MDLGAERNAALEQLKPFTRKVEDAGPLLTEEVSCLWYRLLRQSLMVLRAFGF